MSGPALIYDPNAGDTVAANLDFAADGLHIFNGQGRKLQHWPYAEIVHAHPSDSHKTHVIAHSRRPEMALQVQDDAVYNVIRERAPQLKPLRRGSRIFWHTLSGMPGEAQFGIWIAIGLIGFTLYSWIAGWFD